MHGGASAGPRTAEGLGRSEWQGFASFWDTVGGASDSADSTVAGEDQGFSFGDLHTMNIPGAPKLPKNPFADAAWRRRMNGPK
jgi:hypothetical protein